MPDTANPTATRIQRLLQQQLKPAHLEVRDDSRAHAGHANAGRGHFHVRIVSTSFEGLKPIQRHRLVNETLATLFESDIHALAIEALTPSEFNK
jgi:BolA protein